MGFPVKCCKTNPQGPPSRMVGPCEALWDTKVNPTQPRGTGHRVVGMHMSV